MARNKCRICIEETYFDNVHLFSEAEKQDNHINLIEIIELHLGFKPKPKDIVSTVVCLTCWNVLKDFHDFYLKINEAQRLYQTQAKTLTFSNVLPEEEIPMEQIKIEPDISYIHDEDDMPQMVDKNPLSLSVLPLAKNAGDSISGCEDDELPEESLSDSSAEFLNENDFKKENGLQEKHPVTQNLVPLEEVVVSTASSLSKDATKRKVAIRKGRLKRNATANRAANAKTEKTQVTLKAGQRNIYLATDDDLIRKYIPFNCGECGHNVQDLDELKKHFGEKHGDIQPFIRCCGRKFVKRPYLIQHAYKHLDPDRYKCPDCQKTYTDDYALRTHIIAQHPKEEDLKFSCSQCDKRFARKYLLEFHKGSHIPLEERKFKCDICEKPRIFSSSHLLKSHIAMIHKRDKRICHYCGKELKDKDTLERHIRSHTHANAPRIKCPKEGCPSWLKDADNLKKHMRRHTREGEIFECEKCGKKCNNREALRSHVHYKHSGIVFTCEYCQKTFKRAITLKEHVAQHTGETLYKCPFCERTFNSNANMHSHKKKMHPTEYLLLQKAKIEGTVDKFLNSNQTVVSQQES